MPLILLAMLALVFGMVITAHAVYWMFWCVMMSAFFPRLPGWFITPPFVVFMLTSLLLLRTCVWAVQRWSKP